LYHLLPPPVTITMLSQYCCVITFNLPKPRFTFSCHHLRNSRLFPVSCEYLILLPGKESHLMSSLHFIAGRMRVDQCSLERDYVSSAGFRMTVNQEPCVFLRILSHVGSVFTRIHLHILSLTLTYLCKLTLKAGPRGCRWTLRESNCNIGSLSSFKLQWLKQYFQGYDLTLGNEILWKMALWGPTWLPLASEWQQNKYHSQTCVPFGIWMEVDPFSLGKSSPLTVKA